MSDHPPADTNMMTSSTPRHPLPLKMTTTPLGTGRTFFDLTPEQFANGAIGVFDQDAYDALLFGNAYKISLPSPQPRTEHERTVQHAS